MGALPIFANSIAEGFHRAYSQLCDYKADLDVLVAYTPEEIEDCCRTLEEMLEQHTCDGLIAMAIQDRSFSKVLEKYRAAQIPVVKIMNCFDAEGDIFQVRNDYAMSARMACELLSMTVPGGPVVVFCGSLETTDIHPEICTHFQKEAMRRGLVIAEIFDMHDDPAFAAKLSTTPILPFANALALP